MPICPVTTCFPSLLPEASRPGACPQLARGMLAAAPSSCRAPARRPPGHPLHWAVPAQWPRKGQHLFVLPPYKDGQAPSYREKNQQTKGFVPWLAHRASRPFTSRSGPSLWHSLTHRDSSVDAVLLLPPPALPFCALLPSLNKAQPKSNQPRVHPNAQSSGGPRDAALLWLPLLLLSVKTSFL